MWTCISVQRILQILVLFIMKSSQQYTVQYVTLFPKLSRLINLIRLGTGAYSKILKLDKS